MTFERLSDLCTEYLPTQNFTITQHSPYAAIVEVDWRTDTRFSTQEKQIMLTGFDAALQEDGGAVYSNPNNDFPKIFFFDDYTVLLVVLFNQEEI